MTKAMIPAAMMTLVALGATSAGAEVEGATIADALMARISAEYNPAMFERVEYSIHRNRLTVSADGAGIDLTQTYAYDGKTLGDLIGYDLSVDDNPDLVRQVLGEELFSQFLAGRNPSDVSFDRSCDGDDCDFSFDASGPGFDVSSDGSCDSSGCDTSFDSSNDEDEESDNDDDDDNDDGSGDDGDGDGGDDDA